MKRKGKFVIDVDRHLFSVSRRYAQRFSTS